MKIPKKNYLFLICLIGGTVFFVLTLSNIYFSKSKLTSTLYDNSNKIAMNELSEYANENPDFIMYRSSKYNLKDENFEDKFKQKIEKLNLKDKFVFVDISKRSKKFNVDLKNEYNININFKNIPIILVVIDGKVTKISYVDKNSEVESIINYEAFL